MDLNRSAALNRSAKKLRSAAQSAVPRAAIEPLEPRCLLSATLLTTLSKATSSDPVSVVNVNGTAFCSSADNSQSGVNYGSSGFCVGSA
ncbi:MAG TPA: LEPR-XLL domain-containing protein [Tepidisphaeraceae bacterium]|nr:LEPR-XLL domain-containing protein [Tepidisphaeraceae bacterium]